MNVALAVADVAGASLPVSTENAYSCRQSHQICPSSSTRWRHVRFRQISICHCRVETMSFVCRFADLKTLKPAIASSLSTVGSSDVVTNSMHLENFDSQKAVTSGCFGC